MCDKPPNDHPDPLYTTWLRISELAKSDISEEDYLDSDDAWVLEDFVRQEINND